MLGNCGVRICNHFHDREFKGESNEINENISPCLKDIIK